MKDAKSGFRAGIGRFVAIFIGIALLVCTTKMSAQMAGTGNIQGSVTDATGAVIQGAQVTATNTATTIKHTAVTDASGIYSFPNLAIGRYTIEVNAAGFERYRQTGIVLEVGSSIAVNIALKIGKADQTVEVQASGLALQTEDSSIKQTISEHTVTEMPLNGRQMTQLVTLSGGAVNANENNDESSSKSFFSSAVISIGGGQGNATDYRLDGADHNDYMTNVNLPFPFPDAVAEFSVETAALGAQSGLHPGGLVNVVTRSGSNQWHGSGFEFIRNNYINASNFFSTRDKLHQNQFGGTFGGKIIPGKVFGFVGYQRLVASSYSPNQTAYVPTAANLTGDFSSTDNPTTHPLVDPLTGTALVGNNYANTTLPNGATWSSILSSTAKAFVAYLPTPSNCSAANFCVAVNSTTGAVTYGIPSQPRENQFVTRIDAVLTPKNSLYGRYFLDGYQSPAFFSSTNALVSSQAGNLERAQAFTMAETYTINKNIVNTAHATVTRRRDNRGPAASGFNSGTFGISMYDMTTIGMQVTLSNKWSTYCGTCSAGHFNVNTMSLSDDITWLHGKHQIALGGEYVRSQLNINNVYEGNGNFTFSGVFSQKGPQQKLSGPYPEPNLDFLLGAMSKFEQSKAQQNALRAPIPSLYIQDTFHLTPRIVISGGLRWDPEYFPTDYFGRGVQFNYNAFLNNQFSTVYPNAPAGAFFYGDKGVPKNFTQNTPWQFSPRFGATFDPSGKGKTVMRVGAALVFDEPNLFTGQRNQQNPPFAQAVANTPTTASGPLQFNAPWAVGTVTANPFPLPQVPSSSATFQKQSQYIVLPNHLQSPYVMQWTASLQHEFGRGWQLELSYLGNKTNYGIYGLPMNAAVVNSTVCAGMSGGACTVGNESSRYALTLANSTWGPYYSGGGTGSISIHDGANASYHGMVASIQHRVSSTFVFMANYTWSHCIDISDNAADLSSITIQNPANIQGDKSSCGFDFRSVLNTSLVAVSHFNSLHGILGQTINHWEISPLVHAMSGSPFTVTSGNDNSLTGIGNDRPNLTNPSALYTHNKIQNKNAAGAYTAYVNSAAFTQNSAGTFGASGRFAYRGPKFLQSDVALTREFPLHDRLAMNLRLEAYNVLNHPNFATPAASSAGYLGTSTSLTSSTFGDITATTSNYGPRIFQAAAKVTF